MPQTWIDALNQYNYPVNLADYQHASSFPKFFRQQIKGDRNSTIAFENYFRSDAQKIEAWCEVVFWKLYSQKGRGDKKTNECCDFWKKNITGKGLYNAANDFINNEDRNSFNKYRKLWPFYISRSRAIAVLATHISFLAPDRFPMIDTRIAKWVNSQLNIHNAKNPEGPQLIKSRYGQNKSTVLTMADFDFYLHWIYWTRYMANKLSQQTEMKWRTRDVEMAVFTAWGDKRCPHPRLPLNLI